MILSREIIIGEKNMIDGAFLVKGVEGFDAIRRPVALYAGKLFMPGARFRSVQGAERVMNRPESDTLQSLGDKVLGFHIDRDMSGVLRLPLADHNSRTIWREVMLLPEEVWQRLEALNV